MVKSEYGRYLKYSPPNRTYKHHAREPLYSNSAVPTGWLQSMKEQNILFWFTKINSMGKLFATIHFTRCIFIITWVL